MTQIQQMKHRQSMDYLKQVILAQQQSGLKAREAGALFHRKACHAPAGAGKVHSLSFQQLRMSSRRNTSLPCLFTGRNRNGKLLALHCPGQPWPTGTYRPHRTGWCHWYALNHKEGLSVYLNDGNAALSNNICERAIRSFTIGRKNWLFSASLKGATANAAVYSVIETCKANSIDPFKYLVYLFERMPNTNFKLHPDELDALLP